MYVVFSGRPKLLCLWVGVNRRMSHKFVSASPICINYYYSIKLLDDIKLCVTILALNKPLNKCTKTSFFSGFELKQNISESRKMCRVLFHTLISLSYVEHGSGFVCPTIWYIKCDSAGPKLHFFPTRWSPMNSNDLWDQPRIIFVRVR